MKKGRKNIVVGSYFDTRCCGGGVNRNGYPSLPSFAALSVKRYGNVSPSSVDKKMETVSTPMGAKLVLATSQRTKRRAPIFQGTSVSLSSIVNGCWVSTTVKNIVAVGSSSAGTRLSKTIARSDRPIHCSPNRCYSFPTTVNIRSGLC